MKKAYSTPEIEKINFQYRDQVVVASGCIVSGEYSHEKDVCHKNDASTEYTN